MMGINDSEWEKFKKSGAVCDYLNYRANFFDKDKDSTFSQTNVFQEASNENKRQRSNSQRS